MSRADTLETWLDGSRSDPVLACEYSPAEDIIHELEAEQDRDGKAWMRKCAELERVISRRTTERDEALSRVDRLEARVAELEADLRTEHAAHLRSKELAGKIQGEFSAALSRVAELQTERWQVMAEQLELMVDQLIAERDEALAADVHGDEVDDG